MDFKTFYLDMSPISRDEFAEKASTSRGYCNQIAYAGKQIELGIADVFVTLSNCVLTLDELPLTERARKQLLIRSGNETKNIAEPAKAVA
jgi:hypothetical protein